MNCYGFSHMQDTCAGFIYCIVFIHTNYGLLPPGEVEGLPNLHACVFPKWTHSTQDPVQSRGGSTNCRTTQYRNLKQLAIVFLPGFAVYVACFTASFMRLFLAKGSPPLRAAAIISRIWLNGHGPISRESRGPYYPEVTQSPESGSFNIATS